MICTTRMIMNTDGEKFEDEVSAAINLLINGKGELEYTLDVQYSTIIDPQFIYFTALINLYEEED